MDLFWSLRVCGVAGILGAVLFMLGDLSYNHIPGSKASTAQKMSQMPEARLLRAGVLGLIGCWLYGLAAFQIYSGLSAAGRVLCAAPRPGLCRHCHLLRDFACGLFRHRCRCTGRRPPGGRRRGRRAIGQHIFPAPGVHHLSAGGAGQRADGVRGSQRALAVSAVDGIVSADHDLCAAQAGAEGFARTSG